MASWESKGQCRCSEMVTLTNRCMMPSWQQLLPASVHSMLVTRPPGPMGLHSMCHV